MTKKVIVGLIEEVILETKEGKKSTIKAKIDTGATRSSLDINLALKLKVGPIIRSSVVKSAHGSRLRPVVFPEIEFAGKKFKEQFTLANRKHMKYPILIGVNILKKGNFLVDPSKETNNK
ncbi:ATP-dependent zinc protease [Candidatus Woesearchaeota archaeon]|nr:ATP-dependent zinc protease [Candidatus Woesearchaeota archaeon]